MHHQLETDAVSTATLGLPLLEVTAVSKI